MKVMRYVTGYTDENAYIVYKEGVGEALIIDPGVDAEGLCIVLNDEGLKLTHILLTHGHYDHTGAVGELMEKFDVKLAVSREDEDMLNDPRKSSRPPMDWHNVPPAGLFPEEGSVIYAAGMEIGVIAAPGHTK